MKRTAITLGVAAAMGIVPSVAAAGNATAQLKPQLKPELLVQIFKPQPARTAHITAARVSSHRAGTHRISLLRIQSR